MDKYVETLNQECDKMIESQACFAQAAAGMNNSLSELESLGSQTLSNGQTVDELLGGYISDSAKYKLSGFSATGEIDWDAGQNNNLGSQMLKWQAGYSGTGKQDERGRDVIGAAQRDRWTMKGRELQLEQGTGTGLAKSPKSGKAMADRAAASKTFAVLHGLAGRYMDNADGSLSADDQAIMKQVWNAAGSTRAATMSDGMTKCAEAYDESQRNLQNAAADQRGMTVVDMSLTPEEKNAAYNALEKVRDPETQGVIVDMEVEYQEQCVLLSQIVPLAKFHRTLTLSAAPFRARLPYRVTEGDIRVDNAPLIADGEAYGFINRLTQTGNYRQMFDMDNASIAALQPLIRFYKVIEKDAAGGQKELVEHEIAFDSFATPDDVNDVFSNKAKRGFGVGIKSFDVTFDGQDLFAATRSIKATLKIQANNFDELLKNRRVKSIAAKPDGTGAPRYRYIDLALKTGGDDIEKYATHLDSLNFRLKACFGWNPNVKNVNFPRGALDESFVTVNLTPVTHNFDFDEQGRVTFTIEYYAYVEQFLQNPYLNIFTDPVTFSKILSRRLGYQSLELNASCDINEVEESSKAKADREKADAEKIEKEKSCLMNYLITQLFREDKIYMLKFTRDELKRVVKEGPHFLFDIDMIKAPNERSQEALFNDLKDRWKSFKKEEQKENSKLDENLKAGITQMDVQIPYMYIGDIIDLIMGQMTMFLKKTREGLAATNKYEDIPFDLGLKNIELQRLTSLIAQYEKFRLTLGPLEFYDHSLKRYVNVSFADVPISVAHFTEFLTSKLLKKDQAMYPLMQFLKDLFNSLIKNYLNKSNCKGINAKQKTRLFESCVTSYGREHKGIAIDRITERILAVGRGPRLYVDNLNRGSQTSILNIAGSTSFHRPNDGLKHEFNHFIFFAGHVQPANRMNGNREEDENRGIFHYVLGKDSGIIKNISLTKTESPGLKEVRFESEGFRELEQLREVYDVDVDCYANLRAMPGNYIFVDPRGFAPNLADYSGEFDLTDLGVGGYYMIIRSTHTFAPGIANTRFKAVWVHSKDSEKPGKTVDQDAGKNEKTMAKCNATRKRLGLVEIQTSAAEMAAYEPPKDTVSEATDG
jgi:hypothetical protein